MKLHHVKRLTRMAEILKLSVENDKKSYENVVNKAVKVLQSGGVIAVPTDTVYGLAALWSKVSVPEDLLHDLLPGPVTVIFERDEILNPHLNPATDLVGIRVPDHSFIRRLSSATGSPLALTSANLSSAKSTLSVQCIITDSKCFKRQISTDREVADSKLNLPELLKKRWRMLNSLKRRRGGWVQAWESTNKKNLQCDSL
ncbi:yrdC domain containing [Apostichopus japonicus]|uniref:Threonylcarbamoyl-AMP synthase n=1 Tax=Stichopus japonicus TaxID=307972 RepID=A0A2G8JBM7_STIJA|nr:yrdC domain containing [Apostichopus japonicus]